MKGAIPTILKDEKRPTIHQQAVNFSYSVNEYVCLYLHELLHCSPRLSIRDPQAFPHRAVVSTTPLFPIISSALKLL